MSILARLTLNPGHRDVALDLTDTQRLHRRVMSLLPNNLGPNPREATGTLHRIDGATTGAPTLIVQTFGDLNTSCLPVGYADNIKILDLDNLNPHLTNNRAVRYTLTANPTRRVSNTGKRVGIHGNPLIAEWWQRHAERSGLTLTPDALRIDPTGTLTGTKGPRNAAHALRHDTARISGHATITNATQLHAALRTGIGSGKAHGCGLLTIVPLP